MQSDRAPAAPRGRLCVRHGVPLGSEIGIFLFILIKGIFFFIFFSTAVFYFFCHPAPRLRGWRGVLWVRVCLSSEVPFLFVAFGVFL